MAKKNKNEANAEEMIEQQTEETAAPEELAATEEPAAPEEPTADAPAEAAAEEPAPAEPAPAASSEPAAPIDSPVTGTVMKPVNFRTGPTFLNAAIAELKPGTTLVLEETVEGDKGTWYRCKFDGVTGYVKTSGIQIR